MTVQERFWSKVKFKQFGCWVWLGCKGRGYGQFKLNGKMVVAHRIAYEQVKGPIPKGMQLDHTCSNRACVNPSHLDPVIPKLNMWRRTINLGHGVALDNKSQIIKSTIVERFWSNVDIDMNGCWEWKGYKSKGYGVIAVSRKNTRAHRLLYEMVMGPIPSGLVIDHKVCSNPPCVRPSHLEAVTSKENSDRKIANMTHCKGGHEFTVENIQNRKDGVRSCKICVRIREGSDENKAKRKITYGKYYEQNRDVVNAKHREARAKDPEAARVKGRMYAAKYREKTKLYYKAYYDENHEALNAKARAKYALKRLHIKAIL